MDPALFISTHLDDAVLSAGQAVASWPGSTVLTVATHAPETPMSTDYDQRSGFSTAREAAYCRRMEDRAACAVLGASPVYLGMVDGQYGTQLDVRQVANRIAAVMGDIQPRVVVAPLGIAHADHEAVAEACRSLIVKQALGVEWWVYEDLPSRVLYPEMVGPALTEWEFVDPSGPPLLALDFFGTSDLDRKEKAVRCYRSQLWALDLHACLVPERLHKVSR